MSAGLTQAEAEAQTRKNLERGGLPGVRTYVENNPRLSGIPQWVIEYLIDRVEKLEAEVTRLTEGAA